jgi:transposase-like protein
MIKTEVLDQLLSGVSSPEDLLGAGGVFRQLKKALMKRALGAELTRHLGYEIRCRTDQACPRQQPQRPFGQNRSDR